MMPCFPAFFMTTVKPMIAGRQTAFAVLLCCASTWVHADAVNQLKDFVQHTKQGQMTFTQAVTSPDGKKVRHSSGSLAFSRPGKFRFEYTQPMPQLIVGDGKQVWLYDPDLEQVTVRPMSQAMGATPAALLAGGNLEQDFTLKALPDAQALQWVQALPKVKEGGAFQSVKVGFKGAELVAIEVLDGFGQRSRLDFSPMKLNSPLKADQFVFTPPAGVDVLKQP